jgi:hypothetical protein
MNMWTKGDEAMCLNKAGWKDRKNRPTVGPAWGQIGRVSDTMDGEFGLGLRFEEWGTSLFDCTLFQKVEPYTPDDDDQGAIDIYNSPAVRVTM